MPDNLIPQSQTASLSDRIRSIGTTTGGLVDGLRNFGQAASNAVAEQVAVPVDALAWLLRRGGMPIPSNPVAGTQWMRQQGLTAPTQPGLATATGEAFGNLAPLGLHPQFAANLAELFAARGLKLK